MNLTKFIPFYRRFIAGTNINHAIQIKNQLAKKNIKTILDFSVENPKKINRNIEEIFKLIKNNNNTFIALKFSGLGIDNMPHCYKLIDQFHSENINNHFLIDAEDYKIQERIYELSDYALEKNSSKFKHFFKTLQCYRNDIWPIVEKDLDTFAPKGKYAVKLVRGAYIKQDAKYGIICKSKEETDEQYNKIMYEIMKTIYYLPSNEIMIATHNRESYMQARGFIASNPYLTYYIHFATLLGMADNITYDNTILQKYKYVPYGPFWETTPYLLRRLIENKEIIKHIW